MQPEPPPDAAVDGWLATLGIESLCQWDVLVFLHRHQAALLGADHIARLLGYPAEAVLGALDTLASLGLVGRSRVSQGARLYQFTVPPAAPPGEGFARLLALSGDQAGRLLLSRRLRRGDRPPEGPGASAHSLDEGDQVIRAARQGPPPRVERREPWLKAI